MTRPDDEVPQDSAPVEANEVSIEDALPVDNVSDDVEANTPVEENTENVDESTPEEVVVEEETVTESVSETDDNASE